jgi:arylsulfatase A-like enzyme
MKAVGVVNQNAKMSPAAGDWTTVQDKLWESACMEVYAAMVDQMDQGIGRIVKTLESKGELDNTLIMFMQDNGGCAEAGGRKEKGPRVLRADKPTLPPIAVDLQHYKGSDPKQTRDGYPVRRGHAMPGPADTYIGYGRNWANVSNTPFREYKHYVHEGGISTPFVAHWPAVIKAKNELRSEPSHLVDLMATCVDAAGAKYPEQFKGKPITPPEGKSLLPVFQGNSLDREMIFFEHEGNRALRMGDWKLVAKGRAGQDDVKWELYNIAVDRSELHDLALQEPDRFEKMKMLWTSKAGNVQAIPWPVSNRAKKNNKKSK